MPVKLSELPKNCQRKLKRRTKQGGLLVKPDSQRSRSGLEADFVLHLWEAGLQGYQREYVFAAPRRWRFDFCWVEKRVAVELQGAIWANGRHTRGYGYLNDRAKTNTAITLGWKVLEFSREMLDDGRAIGWLKSVLGAA